MLSTTHTFRLGEDWLTSSIALSIAAGTTKAIISSEYRDKIKVCAKKVAAIVAKGEAVYGINTGFGPLCTTKISQEETQILQTNILKSP